jgi:hypothetical protein
VNEYMLSKGLQSSAMHVRKKKNEAVLGTGRKILCGCKTFTLPSFLDNWLTVVDEVAMLDAESTPGQVCGLRD